MNFSAFLNTLATHNYALPIVILYVTAGCNLRCIMCSYRDPLPNELTLDEIRKLALELSTYGLRHIVYSGGEPLTRRDFPAICELFQRSNVRQSLLTNGLLLDRRYEEVMPYLSEIIVSLDGPTAEVHNRIRGSQAFEQIIKGIERVVSSTLRPNVAIRTVVQRMNFRMLDKMVELAKSLRIDRISFIAADVLSDSFHRAGPGAASDRERIILTEEDVVEFRNLMKGFVKKNRVEIQHRFISEDQDRLFHIVQYFEALVGKAGFPRNVCNAPMVSTVITSTGDLLPCFFLPPFGNMRSASIHQLLNNNHIRTTRQQVKAYSLQRCQECVCTLKTHPLAAAFDRF